MSHWLIWSILCRGLPLWSPNPPNCFPCCQRAQVNLKPLLAHPHLPCSLLFLPRCRSPFAFSTPPFHPTRWLSSPCLWVTGAGITSASPGQPEMASGRRTRMESVSAPVTTWPPGTQLNLEGWSYWVRNRWAQHRGLGGREQVCVNVPVFPSVSKILVCIPSPLSSMPEAQ